MRRLLPAPLLSFGLFVGWLIVNGSTSPGHLLLAATVALAMPALMSPLRPATGPVRHPLRLARLLVTVFGDVIVSGVEVSFGALRARRRPPRGTFVVVPLDLHHAHALAALAMITAVIPGTVWTELAPDRRTLLLHVFDLDDETAFVERFKRRYERPLLEILP
ncbi:MAG: Na+/H+ antiporter subunit E [Burkholderiales bacterium]|nr:MAG: Na+/H+ antiporter subunit E [Burkholderiales bacterium]